MLWQLIFKFKSYIIIIYKLHYQILMGCGSSVSQVSDTFQIKPIKQLLDLQNNNAQDLSEGRFFLFGQTRTNRKILQLNFHFNTFKQLSNRVRIPIPKLNYDPLEIMYEQSQEIFHLGAYGFSMLPPYNKMVAFFLRNNLIFLCGGVDYDHYNIKCQSFLYEINDEQPSKTEDSFEGKTLVKSRFSKNKFQAMASMNKKRYGHMGLYNSKLKCVFIFGGINEKQQTMNSCERYNILENSWRELPSMYNTRAFGSCLQYRSKIYVFGGRKNKVQKLKIMEVYDLQSNQWNILKFYLHQAIEQSLVFSLSPNEILIIGGKSHSTLVHSMIKINLQDCTYQYHSKLDNNYRCIKGFQYNKQIFVFGSQNDQYEVLRQGKWKKQSFVDKSTVSADKFASFSATSESIILQYHPHSQKHLPFDENSFSMLGNDQYPCLLLINTKNGGISKHPLPMNFRIKSKMSIIQFEEFRYFIAGGCDLSGKYSSNSTYFYDTRTKKMQESIKMPEKKYDFGMCYLKNYIYTFGGLSSKDSHASKSCARFQVQTENWEVLPTLRRGRQKPGVQVISQNKIAIFGGTNMDEYTFGIEIFKLKERQFDLFQPKLQLGYKILATYINRNQSQEHIYIFHQNSSLEYQQTKINLQPPKIPSQKHANITALQQPKPIKMANSFQQTHNQLQKPKSQLQQNKYHQLKIEQEEKLFQEPKIIEVKPKIIQVKPKKQISDKDYQFIDEDQSQQFQFIPFNQKSIKIFHEEYASNQITHQVEKKRQTLIKNMEQPEEQIRPQKFDQQHLQKLDVEQESDHKILIEKLKSQAKESKLQPLNIPEQKLIQTKALSFLSQKQYLVQSRLNYIYFICDNKCIIFSRQKYQFEQINVINRTNLIISALK